MFLDDFLTNIVRNGLLIASLQLFIPSGNDSIASPMPLFTMRSSSV